MNQRARILLVLAAGGLVGCATSTEKYTPPTESVIPNTKLVNRPFEAVWDSLVKELSGDFFVINNIDKNSRLINISFSSPRPSEYVDCGVTARTFTNAGGVKSWTYNPADSSNFITTNSQHHAFFVRRDARLEGRTNIYVAPENKGANVTVNTRYVISVSVNATAIDGRPAGVETFVIDPSTKQVFRSADLTCVARGIIEERILRAAQ